MTQTPFGDISRESLDASDTVTYHTLAKPGIHEDVVRQISASFDEPEWMLNLRLNALKTFHKLKMPAW